MLKPKKELFKNADSKTMCQANLIHLQAVIQRTTISESSIYRLMAEGEFPMKPKKFGRIGIWLLKDVNKFLAEKIGSSHGNKNIEERRLIKIKQVSEMTTFSCATIYRLIENGTFPKQIKLSDRSVVWLEDEVLDFLAARTGRPVDSNLRLLKIKQVSEMTALSRSSIYRLIQNETFPKQVTTGGSAAVWIEQEVLDFIKNKQNPESNEL